MVDLRMLNEEYNIPVIHPDEGEWRSRFSWALREVCYGKRLAPELYDAIQEL